MSFFICVFTLECQDVYKRQLTAYVIAHLLKSEPIYESLLGRILAKKGLKTTDAAEGKVLSSFVVGTTCLAVGKKIKDRCV